MLDLAESSGGCSKLERTLALIVDMKVRALTASVLLVFLLSVSQAGHAQSDSDEQARQRDFDVPQLPLTLAL